jgi:hypothetical protein
VIRSRKEAPGSFLFTVRLHFVRKERIGIAQISAGKSLRISETEDAGQAAGLQGGQALKRRLPIGANVNILQGSDRRGQICQISRGVPLRRQCQHRAAGPCDRVRQSSSRSALLPVAQLRAPSRRRVFLAMKEAVRRPYFDCSETGLEAGLPFSTTRVTMNFTGLSLELMAA